MPPKRVSEHRFFEKAEKRPKQTHGEVVSVVNVGDDLDKESTPDSSSPESMAMEQLEDYVRAGNQAAARRLLAHQVVDLNTLEGGDLLWTAYALDKKEMVVMLVHYGADLSVRKHVDNRTLLHHMLRGSRIESSVTRELFRLMLDFGADVDARDDEGRSLLHDAITSSQRGSTELADELLKRDVRITINREDCCMDDISLTCKHKIELLPKLIQHQEPDAETRDQRATIAIDCLISEKYTGQNGAAALLMIEKILRLGVPVNVPYSRRNKRKMSFLDTALSHKNKAAVELLLKYGADPHQQNFIGHTTLYQATAFKETTQVSRWFIERGVNIQACNYHGFYPIHGACKHESLRNLHLLLNLGADLNSTDRYGQTPFGLMKMKKNQNNTEVQDSVIKHLALMIARGEKISTRDRAKINERAWSVNYFEKCTKQLEQMKVEKVHSDVSYFSLLSKNMSSTVQLVKYQNLVESFKRDEKRRAALFPDYFYMLLHSFEIAEKKLKVLLAEKKNLRKAFRGTMPDCIVEKIAYYLCFEKFVRCHHDYFMSFHEKLKNNRWDRRTIL